MSDAIDHESENPEIAWIDAAANPWGVPLLDLRPVTQSVVSTSANPERAHNAISFGGDDGTSFVGVSPPSASVAPASIRFRVDRLLADGILFTPEKMEHKWAIFYHQTKVICVRSWTRQV